MKVTSPFSMIFKAFAGKSCFYGIVCYYLNRHFTVRSLSKINYHETANYEPAIHLSFDYCCGTFISPEKNYNS